MAHLSPSVFIEGGILYAGVVKLADTLDLGSNAEWCAGSSPVTRTTHRTSSMLKETQFESPFFMYAAFICGCFYFSLFISTVLLDENAPLKIS